MTMLVNQQIFRKNKKFSAEIEKKDIFFRFWKITLFLKKLVKNIFQLTFSYSISKVQKDLHLKLPMLTLDDALNIWWENCQTSFSVFLEHKIKMKKSAVLGVGVRIPTSLPDGNFEGSYLWNAGTLKCETLQFSCTKYLCKVVQFHLICKIILRDITIRWWWNIFSWILWFWHVFFDFLSLGRNLEIISQYPISILPSRSSEW